MTPEQDIESVLRDIRTSVEAERLVLARFPGCAARLDALIDRIDAKPAEIVARLGLVAEVGQLNERGMPMWHGQVTGGRPDVIGPSPLVRRYVTPWRDVEEGES